MDENRMEPMSGEAVECDCDREVFERVWKRVMPEGMGEGPIQIRTDTGMPGPRMQAVHGGLARRDNEAAGTSPMEEQPQTLCLGPGSARYAPLLREMMDGEMEDWRLYQMLARRAAGSAAKMLGSMAADERRHVRKLSAAYFLITGERWQARGQEGSRPGQEVMTGLREQFIQEQREAAAYQGAAAESSDPCLGQLFRELAQEEEMHARMIRGMLEQM